MSPRLSEENIVFLAEIFRNELVVPDFFTFADTIEGIFNRCKENRQGMVRNVNFLYPYYVLLSQIFLFRKIVRHFATRTPLTFHN